MLFTRLLKKGFEINHLWKKKHLKIFPEKFWIQAVQIRAIVYGSERLSI
jgi:hypothetical protein